VSGTGSQRRLERPRADTGGTTPRRFEAIEWSGRWVAPVADLLDQNPQLGGSELAVALAVGFGSYAKFYGVIRAQALTSPRDYARR
jgi:hypothetical protein